MVWGPMHEATSWGQATFSLQATPWACSPKAGLVEPWACSPKLLGFLLLVVKVVVVVVVMEVVVMVRAFAFWLSERKRTELQNSVVEVVRPKATKVVVVEVVGGGGGGDFTAVAG